MSNKVLDWRRAAEICIANRNAEIDAGLSEDWFWTGSTIWKDGAPQLDGRPYPRSFWATPVVRVHNADGSTTEYPCFVVVDDASAASETWPADVLQDLKKTVL